MRNRVHQCPVPERKQPGQVSQSWADCIWSQLTSHVFQKPKLLHYFVGNIREIRLALSKCRPSFQYLNAKLRQSVLYCFRYKFQKQNIQVRLWLIFSVKESPLDILWNLAGDLQSFGKEVERYRSSLEKLMHAVGTPQVWRTEFGTVLEHLRCYEDLLCSFQDFKSSE